MGKLGLYDITEALHAAKTDESVKGIYLKVGGFDAGWATLETLREALVDFQSDGKFVYAYSEIYSENPITWPVRLLNPISILKVEWNSMDMLLIHFL